MAALRRIGTCILAGASAASSRPLLAERQTLHLARSDVSDTGATQGGIQPRLEIHDLMQDADAWNIYLLAIQSFKSMDPTDDMSWYRIAGIHGEPYVPYNGVPRCQGCDFQGYCTHSSTLFPTWHRAYTALFEQSLQANALAVANNFTGADRQRYVAVAQNLRAPYWDWALPPAEGENPFPQFFTDPTVHVTTPSGAAQIENPLLQYSWPAGEHAFSARDTTTRNPTLSTTIRSQLRSDLWTLLTSQTTYNEFSTRALASRRNNPSSLEAIHDTVHADIGGDMDEPETAAFDPSFFLHHAMVDRVLALYQAAWPQTWLEDAAEVGDSFWYQRGATEGAQSVLQPFTVASDAIKGTEYYGYTYADLTSGQSAAEIINNLYEGPAPSTSAQTKRSTTFRESNVHHEYIAQIEADLPGSEGSFDLFIFDGAPNATAPETWHRDEDFLGMHGFFTQTTVRGETGEISHASVSLTPALERRVRSGELADLEPETVEAYLRERMEWRVVDRWNREVEVGKIPMLRVEVLTAEVEMPGEQGGMPVWGDFEKVCGW